MNWYVGQQVYCLQNGEGVVIDIDQTLKYPIIVEFPSTYIRYTYTLNGEMNENSATPMLYPAKPEIILPKWQPKPGEWCWFWDEKLYGAFLSKFEKMQDDVFFDWEGNCWQNCAPFVGELLPHLKEVKP